MTPSSSPDAGPRTTPTARRAVPSSSYPRTVTIPSIHGGPQEELGRKIAMTNPIVPREGSISPPTEPGSGAEWEEVYFRKRAVAEL